MRQPYSNELIHHGIKGQKWGVLRFQNPDGTLTPEGKLRYYGERYRSRLTDEERAEVDEEFKRAKEYAINSGSAKAVSDFSKSLTDAELQRAISRINGEQTISRLRSSEIELGRAKINRIVSDLGTIKNTAENLKGIYNVAASVYNAFSSEDKKKLPILAANNDKNKNKLNVIEIKNNKPNNPNNSQNNQKTNNSNSQSADNSNSSSSTKAERKAYSKYKSDHPNSEMNLDEFVEWYRKKDK